MNPQRARILAELGVLRYRLRVPAPPGPTSPAPSATAVADPPAPVAAAAALLTVHAPDVTAAAPTGTAAVIWRQGLAWVRLDAGDVAGSISAEAPAIVLPAGNQWSTAQGKRALWLALKPFAAGRLH